MPPLPIPSNLLAWTRFWSPRKSRIHGVTSEFLEDPQGAFGKHMHPHVVPLSEITPKTGLLVLCGESGLGKSTEIALFCEKLTTSDGAGENLISLQAREFDSFPDLQGHLESLSSWKGWLSGRCQITVMLDGLDEGLIRMPALVSRLKTFLEFKPTDRLRLVLACRSFEWPEAEGEQLASLWSVKQDAEFILELEPLRRKDAQLAAEAKGYDGEKFLEAVYRADVASLASRPITLLFLLNEFNGGEFSTTSRRQLYKNGCRRLCEEHNLERARLLRRHAREEYSTDYKLSAAGKLACSILLGGRHQILFPTSSLSSESVGNVCRVHDLIDCGLLRENVVEQVLGTGLFTAVGSDGFRFTHQTFAECLTGQILTKLPLPQLRTLLCATDPATGSEYVIPQLVELASWVAGDHSEFFTHLIQVDPATLLRSGASFADAEQKAILVERIFELARQNEFFDESGYWRFWGDLNHPGLPAQLKARLESAQSHIMVRRVAIDIAEACRRPELVPTLLQILKTEGGDQSFRGSVAEAACRMNGLPNSNHLHAEKSDLILISRFLVTRFSGLCPFTGRFPMRCLLSDLG